MRVVLVFLISLALVLAGPARHGGQRIIGGEVTTIDRYPYAAAMLFELSPNVFGQNCGGAILNERTILSAAHCYRDDKSDPRRSRIRVGSTFASSGGQVYNALRLINHPEYNPNTFENDIAVVHLATFMTFNALVGQAKIAGPNYILETNDPIWTIGWGIADGGMQSEQLKHVQMRVFSRLTCQITYPFNRIRDNMLCVGSDNDEGSCVVCNATTNPPERSVVHPALMVSDVPPALPGIRANSAVQAVRCYSPSFKVSNAFTVSKSTLKRSDGGA
ncbi:trypsin domain-containing protein [Phthorimaea operculella]|nr:trypsin domain-containing protein [Phthorimaea operculella]